MKGVVTVFAVALIAASCDDSTTAKRAAFEKHVGNSRMGSSSDYWLVKHGGAGPERVALVFAFIDDLSFCSEVAQLYMQKHPRDRYSCERAN